MFALSVHPALLFLVSRDMHVSLHVFFRGGLISSLIGEKSVTQRWEVKFTFNFSAFSVMTLSFVTVHAGLCVRVLDRREVCYSALGGKSRISFHFQCIQCDHTEPYDCPGLSVRDFWQERSLLLRAGRYILHFNTLKCDDIKLCDCLGHCVQNFMLHKGLLWSQKLWSYLSNKGLFANNLYHLIHFYPWSFS